MNFPKNSPNEIIQLISKRKSGYWMRKRETCSLDLFHTAAKQVPAYADFLKINSINPKNILNWKDFQKVPPVNKDNYLRMYKLADLCWGGNLKNPGVLTATSGSTGEPVYFLRNDNLDWQYSVILESFLKRNKISTTEPTLVVVCFGMGLWIAGIITYKAFELAAQRNHYPLSIITPGINKRDIFNALRNIASQYKQIIFAGYPPFIKDIIDGADELNIDLKKFSIRILFAAEAISEEYRDYVVEKTGISDYNKDIINIYGSADIGAMAFETGLPIWVKRRSIKDNKLFNNVFSPINKTPTLAQFIPDFINFEEVGGELLLTGDSSVPLIRYAIGDHGGVFSFNELKTKFEKHGINIEAEMKNDGSADLINELPFVYVYERKDLSATFYGLLIYPEWIKPTFFETKIRDLVSGKFVLITRYDVNSNQFLEVNIELKKGVRATDKVEKMILERIVNQLQKVSSEYRELLNNLKEKAYPRLKLWQTEDLTYFTPGIKQKWVLNV